MRNSNCYVFAAFVLFLCAMPMQAQKLGLEGGINTSTMANNLDFDSTIEFGVRTNFQVGLWGELPLGDSWGIRPSLLYIRKGAQNDPDINQGVATNINYEYLDIPLLAYFGRGIVQLRLGGSIGIPINHFLYLPATNEKVDNPIAVEAWETGVNFSLMGGVAFQFQRFHISAQYQHALTPTLEDLLFTDVNGEVIKEENGAHHRNILISLGYTLWEK